MLQLMLMSMLHTEGLRHLLLLRVHWRITNARRSHRKKSHDSEGGALINTRLVFPNPHQGLLSPPRPEDQLLAQFTREELAREEGHQSSVALKEERRKIWEERRASSTKTEKEREREGSEE